MEQREGDPGDLAGHLGRGCCAEGERKGRGRPLTSGACGSASEPGRWQVGQGRSVGAGASARCARAGLERAALDRESCWAEVGSGPRERREGGSGPRV